VQPVVVRYFIKNKKRGQMIFDKTVLGTRIQIFI